MESSNSIQRVWASELENKQKTITTATKILSLDANKLSSVKNFMLTVFQYIFVCLT